MIDKSIKEYLFGKIVKRNVLKVGNFQLNQGTESNYYYDFSEFADSSGITELGFIFWETLKPKSFKDLNKDFKSFAPDVIVGVANKGIVLALAASTYAFTFGNTHVSFAFDRKEEKQHGERGTLVGKDISNKSVVIVDDVVDSGLALTRTVNTVKQFTSDIKIVVMINRSGIESIDGIPIVSILTHTEILDRICL
jgi:orotate phosphoribosyltransferase